MKNRTLSLLIKISILIIAFGGLLICAFWYPFSISLTAVGAPSGEFVPATDAEKLVFWTQLIFYWILSIPCFVVLFIGWLISENVKKDNLFTSSTAKKLNLSFYILFVSSCVFLVGNIIFTILEWNPFAILYYFIGVIGVVLSFGIYVLSKFVSKAKLLKEENDSIL